METWKRLKVNGVGRDNGGKKGKGLHKGHIKMTHGHGQQSMGIDSGSTGLGWADEDKGGEGGLRQM